MENGRSKSEEDSSSFNEWWFKLRSAERRMEPSNGSEHADTHIIVVPRRSEGRIRIDTDEFLIDPETVYLAAPGQTISLEAGQGHSPEVYWIRFDVRCEKGRPSRLQAGVAIRVEEAEEARGRCERMLDSARSVDDIERFRGQFLLQELLYLVLKDKDSAQETGIRAALERSRLYMERHPEEPLTIGRLARLAEVSSKYYVDLFKKTYGRSAIDYLTEVRLSEAKRLLLLSESLVSEIATRVGYQDEFYFSRKFKQFAGLSPAAYRKSRRNKIAAYMPHLTGFLVPLGRYPYAAPLHPKWTPHYYERYRYDIPKHLSAYMFNRDREANVRALAASRPDLIVATDRITQAERAELASAAEVFILSEADGWRRQLRLLAARVGAEEEAEAWLSRYESKRGSVGEAVRTRLGSERVLVLSYRRGQFAVCPSRGMGELLGEEIGLSLTGAGTGQPNEFGGTVTLEGIAEMDADRILLNISQESETLEQWGRLAASEAWQDLRAVRLGRVQRLASDPWREYSAHAMARKLDDLERRLHGNHPEGFRI